MPIRVPRAAVPEARIGVSPTPTPRDSAGELAGRLLSDAGAAVAQMAGTFASAARQREALAAKRQEATDQAAATHAYYDALDGLDRRHQEFLRAPSADERAYLDAWDRVERTELGARAKGLSPRAQELFAEKLERQRFEYRHQLRAASNTRLRDEGEAGLLRAAEATTRHAADLRRGFVVSRDDAGKYVFGGDVGAQFGEHLAQIAAAEATGLIGPKRAEEERVKAQRALGVRLDSMAREDPARLLALDKSTGPEQHEREFYVALLGADVWSAQRARAQETLRTQQRELEHLEDRARAAQERQLKIDTERFEAHLDQKLRAGDLSESDITMGVDLRLLSGEKVKHLRDALAERARTGGPGDPAAIQRYDTEIYTVPDTPQALRALQRAILDTPLSRYPLPNRMRALNHLEEKIRAAERVKTETREASLLKLHSEAKDAYKEALRVSGPLAEQINLVAQTVLVAALEDLDRNMLAGFPENPMRLYFAKKAEYQARIGAPAMARVLELHRALKAQGYSRPEDHDARITELAARRSAFKTEDAYLAEYRRLRDLRDLELQVQRFQASAQLTGAAQPAGAAKPEPAGSTVPPIRGPRR